MHPNLQAMLDTAAKLRLSDDQTHYAFTEALGIGTDQPEEWSVLAIVANNRLIALEIDDSVIELYRKMPKTAEDHPETQLAIYLNIIIRGAFADYRNSVLQRVQL